MLNKYFALLQKKKLRKYFIHLRLIARGSEDPLFSQREACDSRGVLGILGIHRPSIRRIYTCLPT